MRLFRKLILTTCLALMGGFFLIGCSQPAPGSVPSTEASNVVANPEATHHETAPTAPADAVGPAAPMPSPIQGPPSPEAAATQPLPEVVAVNTAKLGGLVEKTLGKVTVLNIWATWCGPCIHEIPEIVKFYQEMDPKTTAFISLSVDEEADITSAIPKFQREHQVPFPIYVLNERDDEGLRKALRGSFGGGIPTTFFYDREGRIVKKLDGAITLEEMRAIVEPLRNGQPQSQ